MEQLIGERISRSVNLEDITTGPGGRVYANDQDRAMRKPLDLARYIYVRAHWALKPLSRVKTVEVVHDHRLALCYLSVDYTAGEHDRNITMVFREDEATAPDAISALVTERIEWTRKGIYANT